jgi:hypothetical protein
MMRHVFRNVNGIKTYKTYDRALKEAQKLVGDDHVTVLIAATEEGRFFPVAIGERAAQLGLHHVMCVTN